MGCVGVDGLVQGKVGGVVVEGLVERGESGGEGLRETGDPFLEVAFALSGGNGGAGPVVVIEGLRC